MKTILVIILVLAVVAGAIYVATKKFGLFADKDKDGIPDEVEEAVEKGKKTARRVKKKVEDKIDDLKKKPARRGRKPKASSGKDYYKKSGTRKAPAKKGGSKAGKGYYKSKR